MFVPILSIFAFYFRVVVDVVVVVVVAAATLYETDNWLALKNFDLDFFPCFVFHLFSDFVVRPSLLGLFVWMSVCVCARVCVCACVYKE